MKKTFSDCPSRSVHSRDKQKISIPSSELSDIKNNFDICLSEIKERFSLVDLLSSTGSDAAEIKASKDILRYQTVSIDSLLDYYIHQIAVYGLKKMFNEEWAKTNPYKKINIELSTVEIAIQNPENTDWIESVIAQWSGKDTFMSAEKIVFVIKALGLDVKEIANIDGSDDIAEVKIKIDALYNRRTSIVHYADLDNNRLKKDIKKEEVEQYIALVESLCNKVFDLVQKKDSSD
ncbi:MAG TPA: hypothetical protein DHV31_01380 [Clostridiales bacterium]|nr:hypothetical protein [Clostridiales bacterium]